MPRQGEWHTKGLEAVGRREASTSSLLLLREPKGMGDAVSRGADVPRFHSGHLKHSKTKRPPTRGFLCHLEGLGRVPALKTH